MSQRLDGTRAWESETWEYFIMVYPVRRSLIFISSQGTALEQRTLEQRSERAWKSEVWKIKRFITWGTASSLIVHKAQPWNNWGLIAPFSLLTSQCSLSPFSLPPSQLQCSAPSAQRPVLTAQCSTPTAQCSSFCFWRKKPKLTFSFN